MVTKVAGGSETREKVARAIDQLRSAGAQFIFLHGSHATGRATATSDVDVAVHFGSRSVNLPRLYGEMPNDIDVLVLDKAPLELAGRVATYGQVLWEADPAVRVRWQADTRKIWFDEKPRIDQARQDFVRAQQRRTSDG
jgi:predicted nucleotidyltransferase